LLETAVAAARAAGRILREHYAQPHQVRSKGLRNLVTEADVLAQDEIIAHIRARFPRHQIFTEEASQVLGSDAEHRWFIDPLDGTTNYARGIPYFCVSIAMERRGDLVAGVVYDPLGERLFQAEAGSGAWLNGERIRVSATERLIDAVLDLGWARGQAARRVTVRVAQALGPQIGTARTMGAAALGMAAVAAGWEDIFYHPELSPWDMAAGAVLIREAGGEITGLRGEPWNVFSGVCLASNGRLHAAALREIMPALEC